MNSIRFLPENTVFVVLSFEGPDVYATAGGLGIRVAQLSQSLAERGFCVHLFFIGDPHRPGYEERCAGRLILHRWCQWISQYHLQGVYDGEEFKLANFYDTVPDFIVEQIAAPARAGGKRLVVLAEEWHTASTLIRLSDQLYAAGLRQDAVLFWNANNTMGFHRIDWRRLSFVASLVTVSRYMKQIMRMYGVDPLVVPNGILPELLKPVDAQAVSAIRQALTGEGRLLLFKVGRFDPAKCWLMAVDAVARLKANGYRVALVGRGGIEPHGSEVLGRARAQGLQVHEVNGEAGTWQDALDLIRSAPPADVYNLRFHMSQAILRPFYAAADLVLANSKHEPFGLVGLEAMAAGGVVLTGCTGEAYSDGQCVLTAETEDADEIVLHVQNLRAHPERAERIRWVAPRVAARFTWDTILDMWLERMPLAARRQGVRSGVLNRLPVNRPVQDVAVYTVLHQPRRLRLPARPIPKDATPEQMAACLFDENLDRGYFLRAAERCYFPATQQFLRMVECGFKLTIGFSLSYLEQVQRWAPELFTLYRQLVAHPNVELAAVEPYHNFVLLWDLPCFARRMQYAVERLERLLGARPQVADTTELMMSDPIYHTLDEVGFKGAFLDGRPWVLDWRQPTYLYRHNRRPLTLLARHYQLSDDVGYRFSDRNWAGWPLLADDYAGWLAGCTGEAVVLGWDYETFGEHHHRDSGIFEFMERLLPAAQARGLRFCTASEVIERHGDTACDLALPAFPSTWAGSGGMDFFLGNVAQQAVFQLMLHAYNKAKLTGDPALIDLALWLAQSDNLHLIQWYGRSGSEAEVSAYFTPREWWNLGGERIIWEIQQVYKNFIDALDDAIPLAAGREAGVVAHAALQLERVAAAAS